MDFAVTLRNRYEVDCYHAGWLVWSDSFYNLVTTVGKNKLLDATFKDGIAAAAWFVGLVNATSFSSYSVSDTMGSHAGWLEATPYSDVTRPAYDPVASSSGSMNNGTSRALFNVNASGTLQGAFLVNQDTPGGSTGTLYGVGSFSTPRDVISGDIVAIKITLTD